MLFGYFFKEIAGWIKELFEPGIQVVVELSRYKFDRGKFLHRIDLRITNTSESETRIDNITIFDKRMREMQYVTSKTSPREFDIRGSETQSWFCFCHREPTGETNLVKLRLAIERSGKRKLWKIFESRFDSPEKFPS